ncbi:hypothetical protein F5I97DRAFT_1861769 [Phlebopus sp. FC_14]|nr:hypothetical protein F5I97DRAFT_1861769 [Phlebopus sp. FC_14]
MSFPRSPSPPPPMPSPQFLPTPLPSPPPLTTKPSVSRLTMHPQRSPPIPPTLIGSPLLQKTLNSARSHDRLDHRAKARLFGDDDDFGTRKQSENRRCSLASPRHTKRVVARCRSPPPSPAIASPPPPVPPIPAFMLAPTDKKSVLRAAPTHPSRPVTGTRPEHPHHTSRRRCPSTPQPGHAITCMQFFAMHNPSRRDLSI